MLKLYYKFNFATEPRDVYAKRINELTEDNSKIRQVATTVDKYMNPEYYPKKQQQRHRGIDR
ncbi:hypothetical protein [Staphylococcus gallinarum]|uniref:hypothetical protein n=1 Tax=Staphylococcus gallinarum TaxID=1293 RepID=UPI000D1D7E5B|nr:hypothetical protein [Staphylococcus gallinarum]PTK88245.1 hypothetical protein BUZ13_13750 [Staphylococcus gallinarum]PTK88293.1 hypothetical protein BUZ05_13615 [Staphylococcus gallinarum]RIO85674.1 hypothetical protein BUZ06_14155 [Staphylococcus gallinarum]